MGAAVAVALTLFLGGLLVARIGEQSANVDQIPATCLLCDAIVVDEPDGYRCAACGFDSRLEDGPARATIVLFQEVKNARTNIEQAMRASQPGFPAPNLQDVASQQQLGRELVEEAADILRHVHSSAPGLLAGTGLPQALKEGANLKETVAKLARIEDGLRVQIVNR